MGNERPSQLQDGKEYPRVKPLVIWFLRQKTIIFLLINQNVYNMKDIPSAPIRLILALLIAPKRSVKI